MQRAETELATSLSTELVQALALNQDEIPESLSSSALESKMVQLGTVNCKAIVVQSEDELHTD